jgi:hypothetical protein
VVNEDVPPFCLVAGGPAVILKAYNPETAVWETAVTPKDKERIWKARSEHILPTREEYKLLLRRKAKLQFLHPAIAGGNIYL